MEYIQPQWGLKLISWQEIHSCCAKRFASMPQVRKQRLAHLSIGEDLSGSFRNEKNKSRWYWHTLCSIMLDGISNKITPKNISWFPRFIVFVSTEIILAKPPVSALAILVRSNWYTAKPSSRSGRTLRSALDVHFEVSEIGESPRETELWLKVGNRTSLCCDPGMDSQKSWLSLGYEFPSRCVDSS